ncbi:MAG TPA: glycosyltransferase family 4 protein [Longimicrobium sp.]|jgi:glycosyltransferase involved in cell wall biosynthesis|uniref:glycosyltransferase family 4 protein n=1 Tax=Longimicrobium sp. TaxID=2029185 RepID=UPI002ED813EE
MTGRLLWIHQNFVSAREAGNSRAIHLLAALLEAGWRVDLVCEQASYLGARAVDATDGPVVRREGGLAVHRLPGRETGLRLRGRGRAFLGFAARALRYAATLPRPDVVYASSPPPPQLLASLAAAARVRAPLVFEARDLWPAFLLQGGMLAPGPVAEGLWWTESLACRTAAACVAVSPPFAPYLERLGARAVTVALTGGDPALLDADRAAGAAWRRRMGVEDRVVVAYTGSLNEPYGIPAVLRAARRLAAEDPRVVWVFAGEGRGRPEVERAAAETGAVRWLGMMPKDALAPVLLGADLALQTHAGWPLLQTTVSGKLFDYLAAGVPVVSLSGGVTGTLLREAGAGVVVAPDGLAAAVRALAALAPDARAAMGMRGRAWVARHAPAPAEARRIVAVVEAARGGPPVTRDALLRAGLAAGRAVARRAPQRAVADLFGGGREETIRRAFDAWMAAAGAFAADAAPPPMPLLLSDRDRTASAPARARLP